MNDAGEWFIADYGNNRVRKVDLPGIVTTVAGGGTIIGDALATSVKLNSPPSVSLTSSGEMLVIDYNGNVVRKMDRSGFTSNLPGVCSGKGKCVKPDECHCNMGHRGHYCQRA